MATYLQAEPHWTLQFAVARFYQDAKVRPVPIQDLIPLDVVLYDLNIPVRVALDKLDCLIPPYGAALFHPDSVLRYAKRRARKQLKLVRKSIQEDVVALRKRILNGSGEVSY